MIAFFVTDHGFGHAARACAVMAALREKDPGLELSVFSRVPEWFFRESVPGGVPCRSIQTDVGPVQKDPFSADLPETLRRMAEFLPFPEELVSKLAEDLVKGGCRAVVSDISPLGIAVGKAAGIPSVLVENFTWDWFYAPYADRYPAFLPLVEELSRWFTAADVHIQTGPVCRFSSGAHLLAPFGRKPREGREGTRNRLRIEEKSSLVLVTLGGVPSRFDLQEQVKGAPRVTFVVPQDVPEMIRRENMIVLPHRSTFYHPDLVAASDLVIGKLGYSTLAEVGLAGKPFGGILRNDSPESPVLHAYAAKHLSGKYFSEEEFFSGAWTQELDTLLGFPSRIAFPNDAPRAADIILTAAERK